MVADFGVGVKSRSAAPGSRAAHAILNYSLLCERGSDYESISANKFANRYLLQFDNLISWSDEVRLKREIIDMESKVYRGQAEEDLFTGAIESQTSQIPSSVYLGLAVGSMVGSAILKIMGKDNWALFVGQWPAPFLIMGTYNKMVKQHGSDAVSSSRAA